MASCREFELLISRRLDDDLSPVETRAIEAHMAVCPACRAFFDEFSLLQTDLSALLVPPPPDLHARIVEQLQAEASLTVLPDSPPEHLTVLPTVSHQKRMLRNFGVTAAALLIVVSAITFGSQRPFGQSGNGALLSHDASLTPPVIPAFEEAQQDLARALTPDPQQPAAISDTEETGAVSDIGDTNTTPAATDAPTTKEHTTETSPYASPPVTPTPRNVAPVTVTPPPASEEAPATTPESKMQQPLLTAPSSFNADNADNATTGSGSTLLSQEDAQLALQEHLAASNSTVPEINFKSISEDTNQFLFTTADSTGHVVDYSVSRTDGSIQSLPPADAQNPATD